MPFQAAATNITRRFTRFDAAVGWAEMYARNNAVEVTVTAGEEVDDEFIPYSDGVIVDIHPQTEAQAA